MHYFAVAKVFARMEATTSRNEITLLFAELLKQASVAEVDKLCYLVLGRLRPRFEPVEFQMAEKMIIQAVAQAFMVPVLKVSQQYDKLGDLGDVVEQLCQQKTSSLTLSAVYDQLLLIAEAEGTGSQARKIALLARLLSRLDAVSGKYLVRTLVGKLRFGLSEVTILDALSWLLVGDKSRREEIERAYNVSADIGFIAQVVKAQGDKGLHKVTAQVGTPIRTAQAERLPTPAGIVAKLGEFAVEAKYDGFRVQIHLDKSRSYQASKQNTAQRSLLPGEERGPFVRIFSRNLEDITDSFPDVVAAVQQLPVHKAIFDGEAISYNPDTEEYLSFQETVQRRRKHQISQKQEELPLRVFVYDLLYYDDRALLAEPFTNRRQLLEKIMRHNTHLDIVLTTQEIVSSAEEVLRLFNLYVSEGLEGIMCKKLDSVYQAGARNFNWIKYKRIESGELRDTIDAVVMGYYLGKGRRSSFGIGAFLVGVSNNDSQDNKYLTIAKIGTGVSDQQWSELKTLFDQYRLEVIPDNYLIPPMLTPDKLVKPALVVEVRADEISISPMHSSQFALRFPRLIKLREDKSVEEVTTLAEIRKLYQAQPMHGNR